MTSYEVLEPKKKAMRAVNVMKLISAILFPFGGALVGIFVMDASWFKTLKKPDWSPPGWVFGLIWTILYPTMGYASYRIYDACGGFTKKAAFPLSMYFLQLVLNWVWTPLFFGGHQILAAMIEILIFDLAVLATLVTFFMTDLIAGGLFIPYITWGAFAAALNIQIYILNH